MQLAINLDFFKYKRSVSYFSDLPNNPDDVRPGDVYNVNTEFELDGVRYPAYINVVCINTKLDDISSIKWNAFGGTTEICTKVTTYIDNGDTLKYNTIGNTPISSFAIRVSSNDGLVVHNYSWEPEIGLNSCRAFNTFNGNNGIEYQGTGSPITTFGIYCGKGLNIETVSGYLGNEESGLCLKLYTKAIYRGNNERSRGS